MTGLPLILELVERAGEATTLASLAREAAGAIASEVPLVRLTLARGGETWPVDLAAGRAARTTEVDVPLEGEAPARLALGLARGAALERETAAAIGRVLAVAIRGLDRLHRVAERSREAHRRTRDLEARLEGSRPPLVARSPAMRRAVGQAELVAGHDTTVLVLGETGTGKEVLARWIHERSRRSRRPFLAVHCGAIPETLVESELFGHERGAFTGAERRHAGRFERAAGGTLFLDEVGELTPAAQVKLLRVLQDGTYERVGGDETLRADVRVVAATHRRLEERVEAGEFRADLYYRLSVFPIEIPPLRERAEDLPLLARDLLGAIAGRLGVEPPALDEPALAELAGRDWPGNVRELANVLERSIVLARGGALRIAPGTNAAPPRGEPRPLAETLRTSIEAALAASRGRIYGPAGAAARLGLPPSTLQSKMKRLGLRRQDYA